MDIFDPKDKGPLNPGERSADGSIEPPGSGGWRSASARPPLEEDIQNASLPEYPDYRDQAPVNHTAPLHPTLVPDLGRLVNTPSVDAEISDALRAQLASARHQVIQDACDLGFLHQLSGCLLHAHIEVDSSEARLQLRVASNAVGIRRAELTIHKTTSQAFLAHALVAKNRNSEDLRYAIDLACQALSIIPQDVELHEACGKAHHLLGETEKATQCYLRAAVISEKFGRYVSAQAYCQAILEIDPMETSAREAERRIAPLAARQLREMNAEDEL